MNTRAVTFNRSAWTPALMAIAAASALALSLFSVAAPVAASADEQACNNIVNGGRSPDYVWVTADASGLTVNWSLAEDKFGAGGTVTVRGCYLPDGTGAIAQDTENDGSHTFAWSEFGLEGNPCPSDDAAFGGSVDSAAVQTKKSDMIGCDNEPSEPPSEPPSGPPSVPPSGPPSVPPSGPPSVPPSGPPSVPPSGSPEGSVLPGTGTPAPSNSPEGGVKGATGTPAPTTPDTATSGLTGTSLPTVLFLVLLVASLGGLAYVNIGSARRRD